MKNKLFAIADAQGFIALAFTTKQRALRDLTPRMMRDGFTVHTLTKPVPADYAKRWGHLNPYHVNQF